MPKASTAQSPVFTVIGGSGWPMHLDMKFDLELTGTAIELQPHTDEDTIYIPYHELLSLEISGPGTQTTDGGFRGGGIGFGGAAVGILAAEVLNKVTSRTTTNTFLRISTSEEEVFLHTREIEPVALRMTLSPAIVKMEARLLNRRSDGIASELERLHRLYQIDALDDAEFTAAKLRVLGDFEPD